MKLYNFEEHGDRYFVVNTKKKNILHWTGVKENITKDNLDLVKFCIEGNVKILESKISTMYLRLNQTDIKYVKSEKITFNDISEIVNMSEMKSKYREGIVGIVLKTSSDKFILDTYKVVNSKFERREDFNQVNIIKNKVIS